MKRFGFTLAEVLITLGIIGVVAALTLPLFISNHRKQVVQTRLAKFYSTMSQAVKMAEVEYGETSTWDANVKLYEKDENGNNIATKPYPNMEFFNKYFAPYLNDIKVEPVALSQMIKVYFSDGSLATFASDSICFWPEAKHFDTEEKADGTIRKVIKHSGTQYFTFEFSPAYGFRTYRYNWDNTEDKLRNDNSFGCKESLNNERAYCSTLIEMYGWKIPKDYPLKF